mmetsp:Transcript_38090/g.86375  ORF Transcript_38090/g.86375 Transcript_38090/m.86375 type:complete len:252 (+) Transcript_38090:810-1565(+)
MRRLSKAPEAPPYSLRASILPDWIATGVNSGREEGASLAASPITNTCGAAVASLSAGILPSRVVESPTACKLSPAVSATLPVATSTVSNSSSSSSSRGARDLFLGFAASRRCHLTNRWPLGVRETAEGVALCTTRTPSLARWARTLSAHSRSKPRSGMERSNSTTSQPRACRKPAHSSATYPPPTTSTFPGRESSENRSSELMQCSRAPTKSSGKCGRPPTATTICLARTVLSVPLASTRRTSWPPSNLPS